MKVAPQFDTEAALCAAFIAALPKGWTAYNETGGFDILLVRSDGFQIGVEAKLKLNAKVICQAAERVSTFHTAMPGPDCRAVLVPSVAAGEMSDLCPLLNITVIRQNRQDGWRDKFSPDLPDPKQSWAGDPWYELAPTRRLDVPEWVPDVSAGVSAPHQLSFWKIAAIKIAVVLDKRGYVTRQDFADLKISMSRWTQMRWIVKGATHGQWIANAVPDFRAQHPVNFPQIEADYEKWAPKAVAP